MIITREYAKILVRQGKAIENGATNQDGKRYQIVERLDVRRVDHYPLDPGQLAICKVPKGEIK